MTSFDDAIRALARSKGFEVADDAEVTVEMKDEWSGYSEFTITNQWSSFVVTCGGYTESFDDETENRYRTTSAVNDGVHTVWDENRFHYPDEDDDETEVVVSPYTGMSYYKPRTRTRGCWVKPIGPAVALAKLWDALEAIR